MTAAAIPAALGFLAENPLLAAIGGQAATSILGGLFGSTSPFEQASQQALQAQQQLIPQLQRQAAGLPTAATRAQMGQLQQSATRAGQSFAASAQRQGIAGTTPSRAQQGRVQAAQIQGQANILGQSQLAAQQQLLGIGAQGFAGQQQIEAGELAGKQQFLTGLGDFMAWYRQNKDSQLGRDMFEWLKSEIALTRATTGGTTGVKAGPGF